MQSKFSISYNRRFFNCDSPMRINSECADILYLRTARGKKATCKTLSKIFHVSPCRIQQIEKRGYQLNNKLGRQLGKS